MISGSLVKVGALLNQGKCRNTLENSRGKKLECAQPWTLRVTMSGNSGKPLAIQILWESLNIFYLAKQYRMFK